MLKKKHVLILIAIISILFISIAEAVPQITAFDNSKTGLKSYIALAPDEPVTFNVTANEPVTIWAWTVDGVPILNNYDNYTTSWSSDSGRAHYVSVNATNAGGTSNTIAWNVVLQRPLSTSTVVEVNTSAKDELNDAISNTDFMAFISASFLPFTNILNVMFYAIVWFIFFAMMWIRQGSINVPSVVGVVTGGLIISFLPAQYQLFAQAMVILGIFATIYVFYRERR